MSVQVLIDLSKLKTPYSGLGQFSLHFGKNIAEIHEAPYFWNFLVPQDLKDFLGKEWNYPAISIGRRFVPGIFRKYDLWHSIHQDSPYFPSDSNTPSVLTIHDLNFLEEKKGFKVKQRLNSLQRQADRASYITFVSNYAARIANEHLKIGDKPQKVIHNGVEIDTGKKVSRPFFLPEGPFLFTLGMVLRKKNFHVLVDFLQGIQGYNLVIAGDKTGAYAKKLMDSVREKNMTGRIILPGIISEEDKIYLFRHCEAFLFPSLAEGFGLPVIEAMRFGKPVFCSKRSSLPEIGGDCAFYWESFDPDRMKETFTENLKLFQKNMKDSSRKNKVHSLKYIWGKSIPLYMKVYDEVIRSRLKRIQSSETASPTPANNPATFNNRPLRVLHLSSEKSWRGGEQQIAYLIEELNARGAANFIACRKGSIFEQYCREKRWDHYSLSFTPPIDLPSILQIARITRKRGIDIVHMHTSYGHTLGMLSTFFGNNAKLILSRRVDNPINSNWFTVWKYNHKRIERIITVSDAIRNILMDKLRDRSKIVTVHSGIDVSRFKDTGSGDYLRSRFHLGENTVLVGNSSALSDHKDYPTFIRIARYLVDNGLDARFFIIGSGELEQSIRKLIKDEGLEEHVFLTGFLTNLNQILPELDVFLMPSKTEGLGTSILDAFACEVPVVSTRTGGIPEMVAHEKTGLLSPVGDFRHLGDNTIRIIRDEKLRKRLTKNAKKMVWENFSKEITAARTLEIYLEVLSGSHES